MSPAAIAVQPVRLGAVSYLNTLPLIEGLGKLADVSLTLTAPSRLIDLLMDGTVDLALASIIDAQRAPTPVALLPVGMIGSDGATMTVRLFSRVPIERLAAVHADVDSHTSVALLRVILAERFGLRPDLIAFDADAPSPGEPPEALLLIGDKVVARAASLDDYPHRLDLGQAWRELTGLPFVYAAWMCRDADADADAVRAAAAILDRQRRHNATRLGWIAAARAPARGWTPHHAERYLRGHLRFDVTPGDRQAVDRFADLCVSHGVIAERRSLRWID
jgi:chorismate dehydratase